VRLSRAWEPRRLAAFSRPGGVTGPAVFAPDGRTVITGGMNPAVVLWDIADRTRPVEVSSLTHRRAEPWASQYRSDSLAFAPDGQLVIGGSYLSGEGEPAVTVWDYTELTALRADLVKHACDISGRGLTEEEWDRYVPELGYQPSCPG
jgi:WD40 repeat protein